MRRKWYASFLVWAMVAGLIAGGAAGADPLDDCASRFQPVQPTLEVQYRVAYRLLALELRQLARANLDVTGGTWSNRVTGVVQPAALVDLKVGSLGSDVRPEQSRAAVYARILAVATLPDLRILLYGKSSHEWHNPTFGHRTEIYTSSLYDMESGSLAFWKTNCISGEIITNLTNAASMEEQSRQILGTFDVLSEAYRGKRPMLVPADGLAVRVSVDERVVPLGITTRRDRAPVELEADVPLALLVTVAPAKGSGIKARPFRAWVLPYRDAAALSGDATVKDLAARAVPEGLVPLAFDYGLAVGSVRCTLTGMRASTNAPPRETSSAGERGTTLR